MRAGALRRILPVLVVVALALPSVAIAGGPGVNIRWDNCFDDSGVANKLFACDTNTGAENLVLSFQLPSDLPSVSGEEMVVYFEAATPALPDWWQFKNAGTCRLTALTLGAAPPPGTVNCLDWSQGGATGGIGAYTLGSPAKATLTAVAAVPGSSIQDLSGDTEYFAASLRISHVKTVGTGACGGCDVPVCIVFQSLNVVTPVSANNRKLFHGANWQGSQIASWQNAYATNVTLTCNQFGGCETSFGCVAYDPTPTRASTWGAVKSLYR